MQPSTKPRSAEMPVPPPMRAHDLLMFPASLMRVALIILPALFSVCTEPREIPYSPIVVFTGSFGDDRVEMPGNSRYPNECYTVRDTLRMRFFTADYSVREDIWYGDQLRIDLYPDSISTDSNQLALVGHVNSFIKLSRYLDGSFPNKTYRVGPSDSAFVPPLGISMQVEERGNRPGTGIRISHLWAGMHREGRNGYTDMVIDNGTVTGAVGTPPEK